MVHVALVDDHVLMRTALAAMINGFPGYRVVLEARNGAEFVKEIRSGPPVNVAIVDLHMPVMDGYATLEWLRTHCPDTKAIVLSFEQNEDAKIRAIRAGACGFVLKDTERCHFEQALHAVSTMGYYHSAEVQQLMANNGELQTSFERKRVGILEHLTERELQFIRLVCDEGEFTYDQITDRMKVHRRTVDGYRESVFEKFNIKSKTGLVLFALRWGLLK